MTKTLVIDPPSGWKYGFPKAVPAGVMKNNLLLRLWLSGEGYPTNDMDWALKHCRYWEVTEEE